MMPCAGERVEVRATERDLGHAMTDAFFACGAACMRARGSFSVALAGGETPRTFYSLLGRSQPPPEFRWERVQLFFGDERAVAPDDALANYRMVREALFEPLALNAGNIHRMEGEGTDLDEAARRYEEELADTLGAELGGAPPRLDLVLLGMGGDGHTASLFAGSDALDEARRWVVATRVGTLESWRLTLTLPVINAARSVWIMVTGGAKATMLARARAARARGGDAELPISRVRSVEGELVWWTDEAASAVAGPRSPTDSATHAFSLEQWERDRQDNGRTGTGRPD
jgi:6-phosphogluconolactonase